MKSFFEMNSLRENLFGKLPFLHPTESLLLRFFMIPNLFLLRAEGLEHIRDQNGPVIFACNHNNSMESLLVPAFLVYHSGGRKISFVIDWMFGKIPLLGYLFKKMEPIYVYHKRSPSRFLESRRPKGKFSADTVSLCCEKLRAGKRIGIFPEGKRNRDPFRLLRAKPGVGHIALRSGVPVVPVGIKCVSGKKRKKVHAFGRIILKIGKPVQFGDLSKPYCQAGGQGFSSLSGGQERHSLAQTATNRIMSDIAALCGKEYPCPVSTGQSGGVVRESLNNNNHNIREPRFVYSALQLLR